MFVGPGQPLTAPESERCAPPFPIGVKFPTGIWGIGLENLHASLQLTASLGCARVRGDGVVHHS